MGRLLSSLFGMVRRYVLLFAGIVLVLACGTWLRDEWDQVSASVGELPALRGAQGRIVAYQASAAARVRREAQQMSAATLAQLDARVQVLDADIRRLAQVQDTLSALSILRGGHALPAQLEQAALRGIELELRRQERAYLGGLRVRLDVLLHREAALQALERLRRAYLLAFQDQEATKKRLAAAYARRGWIGRWLSFSAAGRQVRALEAQLALDGTRTEAALARFRQQKQLVAQLPEAPDPARFDIDAQRLASAAAPLTARLRQVDRLAAQSVALRAYRIVQPVLGAAVIVLASWVLVPFAIRAVFYFVLAPLAARARPIVIDEKGTNTSYGFVASAVSARVRLGPGDEMLVRPAYCQSQPDHVEIRTRVLFDWSYWLPSIAAHLWLLDRVRTAQPAGIVVSSTVDPLEEVALLEIPAGGAFVLKARALVGVVHGRGRRPRIRSHWRLGTLHAWLTLQLRYLSFEGPATLIVKGCRGVRFEQASDGRSISQDATLGFSTNVRYATVRARPFLPYMLGRRALLNDRFTGDAAYYLYEEIPGRGQPGYRSRSPLEALVDAGLKALGV